MTRPARIGMLRRRLQLDAAVETPDGAGGFARGWQFVTNVWARIEPVGAADTFEALQGLVRITHRIKLRWRADIAGGMRLRDGDRTFLILSARDASEERRHILCQCAEDRP